VGYSVGSSVGCEPRETHIMRTTTILQTKLRKGNMQNSPEMTDTALGMVSDKELDTASDTELGMALGKESDTASDTELGAGWAGKWGTLWARRSAANQEKHIS
jgi:hypothetical protein